MFHGQVYRLSLQSKQKRWQFPEDRFVEFGPEDESYCRAANYGREVEGIVEMVAPDAVIEDIGVEGNYSSIRLKIDFWATQDYFDFLRGGMQ